ncbi:aminodeoxychorismate lyase [Kitasatospora sp. NPDC008050]|uniref:aminodeoxychorismate lyase n=1 Tax=Kitasatospora sp. NPDC008050 TaxID=3364021 RepID=UPI0036E6F70F
MEKSTRPAALDQRPHPDDQHGAAVPGANGTTSVAPPAQASTGILVRLDGTVADRTQPELRADDLAALRGDGVFEALLVADGRPVHLDAHLDRLARSAAALGLRAPDRADWRRSLAVGIAHHGTVGESYARLVLTRGPEGGDRESAYVLIDAVPDSTLRARRDGVRALTLTRGTVVAPPERAPWLLNGAKTLSYAVNMAAQRWAREHEADEAIFLAEDGTVLEAPTAAVLLLTGGRLLSPTPELGILPSITLQALFAAASEAGWECEFARLSVGELRAAEGVWLLSSVRLGARVRSLDGVPCPPSRYDAQIAALVRALPAGAAAGGTGGGSSA